jgi:hypothetical protein
LSNANVEITQVYATTFPECEAVIVLHTADDVRAIDVLQKMQRRPALQAPVPRSYECMGCRASGSGDPAIQARTISLKRAASFMFQLCC